MKAQKALNIGLYASLLPHLVCCVTPIVLVGLALVAPGLEMAGHEIVPHSWMPYFFALSLAMLCFSYWFVFRRRGCECTGKYKAQKIILYIATALFIISLAAHLFAHHDCVH